MRIAHLQQYLFLMRLHKPIGILLLLWPTLWALWLATGGKPDGKMVIIFIIGVILMRSAGCIINDYADRHVDAHVERTRYRPLATGKIRSKSALFLFCVLSLCAFSLVLYLNPFTVALAFVGLFLAAFYPFMKRFTHLPQLGLGLAFAWGVPMAFAAETNAISWQAWIVFLAAAIWPVIYDTMYAMVDRSDDVKIGIKSTAILFGKYDSLIIGLLQIVFLGLIVWIGILFQLNYFYFLSVVVAAILCIYQQLLLRSGKSESYFKAFLNNHWVGCVIFLGIVLGYRL